MAVQMDWQINGSFKCFHQFSSGLRRQQPSHILDGYRVAPEIFQFLGKAHKVVYVVDGARCITDCTFCMLTCSFYSLYRDAHVTHIVHGIEDPEYVYAVVDSFLNESSHHVI